MKPGVFQGKRFPFTPKRRKKSLGSQCNNIIDTRHDLAASRSKLVNVSWLRSYTRVISPLTFLYAFLLQLNVTPLKYKERRPWPSKAQVRPTPPDSGRKVLKPKGLLQSPPGAPCRPRTLSR